MYFCKPFLTWGFVEYSVSWWIALPLEYFQMQRGKVFHFLRTNLWGFTQVYGMLMIGPQEVVWWKPIGQRRPLRLTIVTSTCKVRPVRSFRMGHGKASNLMHIAEEDWDGFRRISWFITIVTIGNVFLKVYQQSVDNDGGQCMIMVFVRSCSPVEINLSFVCNSSACNSMFTI